MLVSIPAGEYAPGGVAVDPAGTVYFANRSTRKIDKLSLAGVVNAFVGSAQIAPATDGVGAQAGFGGNVDQLVYDAAVQTLYAVDRAAVTTYDVISGSVRRISAGGEVSTVKVSTYATHDPRTELPANYGDKIASLAIGADGKLYALAITTANSHGCCGPHVPTSMFELIGLRQLNADGSGKLLFSQENASYSPGTNPYVSSYSYSYNSDTSAGGAWLGTRLNMALDRAGNGYFADFSTHVIYKVTASGVASIVAGAKGSAGAADGAGSVARFNRPTQMVADSADNLYVLDRGNATIRKITPSGQVTTVAGTPGKEETIVGDLPGALKGAAGLAIDATGRLYVTVEQGIVRIKLP